MRRLELASTAFSKINKSAAHPKSVGGFSFSAMRLTHIKLAGFKSFVDPTTINVPGRLVGVVGPNGCGKSNIIDAVRWVLGESRASALRGDSMQDVIFNGSLQRSPVARASVELMFDNSLGKAAGQWSQYAEISVKRVLERNGESSYYINGTHVRRRDVQDIFMGTGLGPRAYAIIEQGMISRIIEAKPEDLRIFLEEAAGISKYKERRRETEHRLSDTRENLARVDDIRQELGTQIEKLERQAEVARRFNELNAERVSKQNLLWLLRKRDAESDAGRHSRDIEQSTLQLESDTAKLRETERILEQTRSEHYAASDAANEAQGELYQANSEVSRLESEIRHIADTRSRLDEQRAQLLAQIATTERQAAELEEADALWNARSEEARERIDSTQSSHAAESEKLPAAEQFFRAAQAALQAKRDALSGREQARGLELAHLAHAAKSLASLAQRRERLDAEYQSLPVVETEAIERVERELSAVREEHAQQEARIVELSGTRGQLTEERASAQAGLQALEREMSALEAKLATLVNIQRATDDNDRIHGWLEDRRLVDRPRLWQRLSVQPGWELAVEGILRERLHALEMGQGADVDALLEAPPPVRLAAYSSGNQADIRLVEGLQPLSRMVSVRDASAQGVIDSWLAGYYAADAAPDSATRQQLPAGTVMVSREGHQFSRFGVSFFAPEASDTGVLERQREIDLLEVSISALALKTAEAERQLHETVGRAEENEAMLTGIRALVASLGQRIHENQLEDVRLKQALARREERVAKITAELAEIELLARSEQDTSDAASKKLADLEGEIDALRAELADAGRAHLEAEQRLADQRNAIVRAERDVQNAGFQARECEVKLDEISRSLRAIREQHEAAVSRSAAIEQELSGLRDEEFKNALQQALDLRVACERAVAEAREKQGAIGEALRATEEERLVIEHRLQPLREKIAELRLKEQAARLAFEQFSSLLLEAAADEALVAAEARDGQRPAPLQGEITRLANAISELGPINMAALDELSASQERKAYLDAQSADLAQALETLESAIRKIDRETRDLLKTTFDAVNAQFSQMFPALFGGGEARLEMTGEEILDSGVEVIARPPGKKNSTIHLLSGGEKALTAISLVFSMFQLNPAPFCLLDEVDAPLDDANTGRFCDLVSKMAQQTQFLYISHNKITMEMASHLVGVTMQEQGVSRVVAVDIEEALKLREPLAA